MYVNYPLNLVAFAYVKNCAFKNICRLIIIYIKKKYAYLSSIFTESPKEPKTKPEFFAYGRCWLHL